MVSYKYMADTIKSYRKKRKISQTVLAELLGMQQWEISNIENCKSGIDSIKKVCMIADYLEIPLPVLFLDEKYIIDSETKDIYIETELGSVIITKNKKNKKKKKNQYNTDVALGISSTYQKDKEDGNMPETIKETINNSKATVLSAREDEFKVFLSDEVISDIPLNLRLENISKRELKPVTKKKNNNTLLVGASGTGKSKSFIEPNIKACNGNYIVTDYKSIKEDCEETLKTAGYKVLTILQCDKEPNTLKKFNVLELLETEEDIILFSDIITKIDGITYNQFFNDAEGLLLKACLLYMKDFKEKSDYDTLDELLKKALDMEFNDKGILKKIALDECFNKIDTNALAWKYYNSWKQASGKTTREIVASLYNKIPVINSFYIEGGTDDIINDLSYGKTALFIKPAISIKALPQTNTISLILKTIISKIINKRQSFDTVNIDNIRPLKVILDGYKWYETPDIMDLLSKRNSTNVDIAYILVLQSITHLMATYPELYMNVLDRCNNMVCMGVNTTIDMEFFIRMSKKYSKDTISPNTIRDLPKGNCIVIQKKKPYVIDTKIDFTY